METAFLAEIATIVGAVSILLTLVFVVIELKNTTNAMWGYPSRNSSKERVLKLVCNHKS